MKEGRGHFYGAVTVSDRGQIVIPAQARRDLNIEVGEKLLVLGGPAGGLILIRAGVVSRMLLRWTDVIRRLGEEELEEIVEETNGEGI
ncbi:MAG TPA: AbrB family transcriptional regulator [Anaerolineales bacterium]|nr:AbrB family transcriptional regulator [Anaerolineae bacterium]HIQ01275.1 AbrB family transcriptional regulator [Anaerolineales bacterium]